MQMDWFLLAADSNGRDSRRYYTFFRPDLSLTNRANYTIITISVILLVCLILQIITIRNDEALAGRFIKLAVIASMSAPLSMIVVSSMYIAGTDESTILSCLSTSVFGGIALLIALNMITVSMCGYKSTRNSIRVISRTIKRNQLVFARMSIIKDVFLVAGKSILSIISVSFFMFVNAMYSMGMGIARHIAVKMHAQDKTAQIKSYRLVGIIISISSICYVLYSVRLFYGGTTGIYNMNVALVIALYTFVEFGINIREALKLHKSKALEAKALRAIGFSIILLCFVLTQTAIMSFSAEGDTSFANALSGVVFGGLASLVGLYVFVDSFIRQKA